jgi:sarcosine oxidase, subunit alpha
MHVLRAEKGYVIVGQETDGTVTPDDVGLGWTIGGGDFVGKRSVSLPDLKRPDRKQLVGLLPADPAVLLQEGAQVTAAAPGDRKPASADDPNRHGDHLGHVTSSYRSATMDRGFALALIAGGRSRIGSELSVPMPGGAVKVAVTDSVFVDPPGKKLRPSPAPRPPTQPLLSAESWRAPVARPSAAVRLAMLAPTTRLSVQAGSAAATRIGLAIGVLLPTVPCRSVISRDRAALWLGPGEWLIVAPPAAPDLPAQARNAAADHPASVVDVSNASHTLEIAGPRAAWCLNAFCALDLDVRVFPVGMCTRTRLGQAQVVLWRIASEVFHLDVPRSLTPYVWGCLEDSRLEFSGP